MRKGCQACGRGLPWNGGELVALRELCPRCATRARAAARADREALEALGQQTCFTEEVPIAAPVLGGLFAD